MNLSNGLPYSLLRYGLPFQYPKLDRAVKTEVLIIGGGISGALNAYYLTKAGISCIIADQRTIGLGSTAACTSLLQYEIDVSLNDLTDIHGEKKASQAYLLCNEALHTLKKICEVVGYDQFFETESLYFAHSKKDSARLEKEALKRRQIGIDAQFISAHSLQKRYSIQTHGGILSSNAGYVDAYSLTHAILQYCLTKSNTAIYDRTRITNVKMTKQGVEAVTDDDFRIKAKHVIYATGYETTEMLKRKIVDLKSTYVTISETMESTKLPFQKTLLWNTASPYLYMRCTDDGRIIVGGRDDDSSKDASRDKNIARKAKALAKDFKKLFPSIEFKPEFNWAGTFASTYDGLPFIGNYDQYKNKHFALGFGGNGIIFSVIAAATICDAVRGRVNKQAQLFSFDRKK